MKTQKTDRFFLTDREELEFGESRYQVQVWRRPGYSPLAIVRSLEPMRPCWFHGPQVARFIFQGILRFPVTVVRYFEIDIPESDWSDTQTIQSCSLNLIGLHDRQTVESINRRDVNMSIIRSIYGVKLYPPDGE